MRAMYDRESKCVWLVHDDMSSEQLGTADTRLEAYNLAASVGFTRMGDWMLVDNGSPLRYMDVWK